MKAMNLGPVGATLPWTTLCQHIISPHRHGQDGVLAGLGQAIPTLPQLIGIYHEAKLLFIVPVAHLQVALRDFLCVIDLDL